MHTFRHSPIVRTLALLLTLNLTLWSCASAPQTETERLASQGTFVAPVPVDSVIQTERGRAGRPGLVRVTMTDSAVVSLDGFEPEFYGGKVVELRELSSRADTLLGVGGPPGPGVKHAYVIPGTEIAMLEIVRGQNEADSGSKAAIIVIGGIVAVALAVGLGVAMKDAYEN